MTTAAKDNQGYLFVPHVKNKERMTAIIAIFEVRVSIMPEGTSDSLWKADGDYH
jgi:hypothetical protein